MTKGENDRGYYGNWIFTNILLYLNFYITTYMMYLFTFFRNSIVSICSSMYPHPLLGVHVENVCTYPQPPPELKNVTKIFYTKYFLTKLDPRNVYLIQ